MIDLLDRFHESIEKSLKQKFWMYIVKVSQVKGSFYALIRKPRGKILNEDLKNMINHKKIFRKKFFKSILKTQAASDINFFHTLNQLDATVVTNIIFQL